MARIINGNGEHSIEVSHQINTEVAVPDENDLRVRVRTELVAQSSQPITKLNVIVDLAVEDDHSPCLRIYHWLFAGRSIND